MHVRNLNVHTRPVSQELQELAERFEHEAVTFEEVIGVLRERAYTLMMIILALPFCSPVTPPGLSTPMGLVIALIAARFALGLPPWLPRRLLQTRLPPRFFRVLMRGAGKILAGLERVLRPRLLALTGTARLVQLHAAMVCASALLLLIPAPIPFSNTLPALAVLFGAAGTMERDGATVLAGYFFATLAAAYFALIAVMGTKAFDFIVQKLSGG
jgi:hypothetical protein